MLFCSPISQSFQINPDHRASRQGRVRGPRGESAVALVLWSFLSVRANGEKAISSSSFNHVTPRSPTWWHWEPLIKASEGHDGRGTGRHGQRGEVIPNSLLPSHSSKFYLIPKVLNLSVTVYEREIDPQVDIFLYQSQPDAWRWVRRLLEADTCSNPALVKLRSRCAALIMSGRGEIWLFSTLELLVWTPNGSSAPEL